MCFWFHDLDNPLPFWVPITSASVNNGASRGHFLLRARQSEAPVEAACRRPGCLLVR